uniref:Uncharacterized protein n=1 Tax=Neospora caninum (strain Liverpool) TaxID=572307 RepID=A0A0F7U5D5_NEOCL|nr:TPA: hypothetical protein BN1204_008445 [Neospora caninum Liverpool]
MLGTKTPSCTRQKRTREQAGRGSSARLRFSPDRMRFLRRRFKFSFRNWPSLTISEAVSSARHSASFPAFSSSPSALGCTLGEERVLSLLQHRQGKTLLRFFLRLRRETGACPLAASSGFRVALHADLKRLEKALLQRRHGRLNAELNHGVSPCDLPSGNSCSYFPPSGPGIQKHAEEQPGGVTVSCCVTHREVPERGTPKQTRRERPVDLQDEQQFLVIRPGCDENGSLRPKIETPERRNLRPCVSGAETKKAQFPLEDGNTQDCSTSCSSSCSAPFSPSSASSSSTSLSCRMGTSFHFSPQRHASSPLPSQSDSETHGLRSECLETLCSGMRTRAHTLERRRDEVSSAPLLRTANFPKNEAMRKRAELLLSQQAERRRAQARWRQRAKEVRLQRSAIQAIILAVFRGVLPFSDSFAYTILCVAVMSPSCFQTGLACDRREPADRRQGALAREEAACTSSASSAICLPECGGDTDTVRRDRFRYSPSFSDFRGSLNPVAESSSPERGVDPALCAREGEKEGEQASERDRCQERDQPGAQARRQERKKEGKKETGTRGEVVGRESLGERIAGSEEEGSFSFLSQKRLVQSTRIPGPLEGLVERLRRGRPREIKEKREKEKARQEAILHSHDIQEIFHDHAAGLRLIFSHFRDPVTNSILEKNWFRFSSCFNLLPQKEMLKIYRLVAGSRMSADGLQDALVHVAAVVNGLSLSVTGQKEAARALRSVLQHIRAHDAKALRERLHAFFATATSYPQFLPG